MGLPNPIPIFPLPNVVLFPGVPLPLHIFEPRYRDMIRDVEQVEDPVIGLVLLRGDWRKEYHGHPEVFPVGCAGRVVRVEPLEDGRYNILLQGLREFHIDGELRSRSYRQAYVSWRGGDPGSVDRAFRDRVKRLMERFLTDKHPKLARQILDDPSVSDELLVNFFCYALDFSPLEKQALLEAVSVAQRGERLCEVVQFALDAGDFGAPGDEWRH